MSAETGLSPCVSDLDFKSHYPNIMRGLNISRMTLTFAPYAIEGKEHSETRRYFSNLVSVRENAEPLCVDFHSLPTYKEMGDLIEESLLL